MRVPRTVPLAPRSALLGAGIAGAAGGIAGLVQGLRTYPPTAWFAIIEIGVPAAMAGALIGPAIATFIRILRRARGSRRR